MISTVGHAANVGRRTIVKGAAWAVPAITVAAGLPTVPTSGPCMPYDLDLVWTGAGYTRNSNESATYSRTWNSPVNGSSQSITVTLSSVLRGNTLYGYENSSSSDNLRLSGFVIGGTGAQGITMHQYLSARTPDTMRNNRQELTFTFSRPVFDLSFGITDIDSNGGDFWDHVELTSTTPFTYTNGPGNGTGATIGSGTQADPWHNESPNNGINNDLSNANANISFLAPVDSFTIWYWDNRQYTANLDNDQKIFITNLDFKVSDCEWNE